MKEPIKCKLLVLGDNSSGKTALIRRLVDSDSFGFSMLKTISISSYDWIIESDVNNIFVDIKERPFFSLRDIHPEKESDSRNLFVILVVRKDRINEVAKKWNAEFRKFSGVCTIVLINNFDHNDDRVIGNHLLKNKIPRAKYILETSVLDKGISPFFEFKHVLEKIIINNSTDSLGYAKELIAENLRTKRKTLDLGGCNLTSLSEVKELFLNTHLESLILSNEWGEFTSGRWQRKITLNKGKANVLFDIPNEIRKLKNLRTLICGGNWNTNLSKRKSMLRWGITDISPVTSLHNLEILNGSNNYISKVGSIGELKNLKKIYLNNNRLKQFSFFKQDVAVQELYLSNNLLSSLDFLKDTSSLKTLDLHSNRITDLLPIRHIISAIGVKDTRWEPNTININNNNIKNPALSVILRGKRNVLSYFKQQDAEERISLKPFSNRDIKLILVGNGNVGKSTLIHWLINKVVDKSIKTTHWLDVKPWVAIDEKKQSYNVRIFDFGGQEYYHDTHHLFFTNRTAYVLLWDKKTNVSDEVEIQQFDSKGKSIDSILIRTYPIEYWLDSISFHTNRRKLTKSELGIEELLKERDEKLDVLSSETNFNDSKQISKAELLSSSNENVIVCQNKVDNRSDKAFLEEGSLKKNHKNIFDFCGVSVYSERGLVEFEKMLFEVFSSLEITTEEYLGTWGHIKTALQKDVFTKPLSIKEFTQYCNNVIKDIVEVKKGNARQIKEVLFDEKDAQLFSEYLSDVGLALYYPESIELNGKVFLNQNQILKTIYQILLNLHLFNGQFDQSKVMSALGKESVDDEVEDVISLMIHFKIVFKHPSKDNVFIAPLYLPSQPPNSIKLFYPIFSKTVFRYQYESFIHKNIILDFFSNYGKKALKADVDDWYYFWRDGIILKDEKHGELIMVKFVQGNMNQTGGQVDIYALENSKNEAFLNEIILHLDKVNEGWKHDKCVSANGQDFVPLRVIHKNESLNNLYFQVGEKYFRLQDFKKFLKNPTKMKKIFISYSKLDFEYVNEFLNHLSALQLDGKVSHWYCSELAAGSKWNSEIEKHFDEADIVCFMISANFMKTTYIHEYEVARAFERIKTDTKFKIVPIVLNFCSWSTLNNNLGDFTAIPYAAKPIADFDNKDMAWFIVQDCLRLVIEDDLEPKGAEFYVTQPMSPQIRSLYKRIVAGQVDKNTD